MIFEFLDCATVDELQYLQRPYSSTETLALDCANNVAELAIFIAIQLNISWNFLRLNG